MAKSVNSFVGTISNCAGVFDGEERE